jgi:cardiolipin synthase
LLEFGVRVFEYSKGVNHSKTMLIDEEWMMIGSANFDNRSMRLNFELNLISHMPEQARLLEKMMCDDFDASKEVLLHKFRKRPFRERIVEAALRPFSPVL